MAKLRGTGIAAVNYPTGMNLGGDPSQALIHATTSGSFNVVLAAADLGQGLRTVIGPDRGRDARRPVRPDRRRHRRHRHRPPRHGHVRQPGHPPGRQRRQRWPRIEAREARARSSPPRSWRSPSSDLELDGAGQRDVAGSPPSGSAIADLASRAQFQYGRTIAGRGAWMKPKSAVDPETGAMDPDSTQAHACTVAEVEVDTETGEVDRALSIRSAYEVGRQVNPALVQGQIVGGAWMGMSHALYETTEPYYPVRDHSPKDFAEYLMPGPARAAGDRVRRARGAVRQRPVRGQGRGRDDRQLADPGHRQRHLPRDAACASTASRSRPRRSSAASTPLAGRRTEEGAA